MSKKDNLVHRIDGTSTRFCSLLSLRRSNGRSTQPHTARDLRRPSHGRLLLTTASLSESLFLLSPDSFSSLQSSTA